MVRRVCWQHSSQMLVGLLEGVVGHRGEEVVEGVVADREGKEEEREWVARRKVAGVEDVGLHLDPAAIALEVMVGQLP